MPPARPAPAQSIPIRPVIINKPIERIERTYIEGYTGPENAPTRDTGPIERFVLPPMEQTRPQPIVINVAQPTSPSGERAYEPPRVSPRDKSERERDYRTPATPERTGYPPVEQRRPPTDPGRTDIPARVQPVHPGTSGTDVTPATPEDTPPTTPVRNTPVGQVPEVGSSGVRKKNPPDAEEKSSGRKKPEVKASQPPEVQDDDPTSGRKRRTYNGKGGRIHTEAQIDELLDFYLMTGELPIYVSDRQRYDYRHHLRLPERKEILAQRGISVKN